ncbi:TadE family protein [Methylocella silvestris BL2]|uniref:TadE family protein n=1 Tax=Methylocella silvestris (strain DSM 15510 / CIP 108128 / LMG 27833 / NCIMB 13906 / BL2) TaxID=395965 RepID=B8ERQ9_METSB|nr:TadE/TadG family type IV pilus assembly protein [Methylocella silvestris]ACK51607.1 TadE family protein [Methylocella silvestris BL2]
MTFLKSKDASASQGSAAIEFGLILPVLLLFLIGIMDMGRLLWANTTLSWATETAARCAAINTTLCGSASQIQSYAVTQAWGVTLLPAAFTVTYPSCGVQVAATYTFQFIIPWLGTATPFGSANTATLSATACDLLQH